MLKKEMVGIFPADPGAFPLGNLMVAASLNFVWSDSMKVVVFLFALLASCNAHQRLVKSSHNNDASKESIDNADADSDTKHDDSETKTEDQPLEWDLTSVDNTYQLTAKIYESVLYSGAKNPAQLAFQTADNRVSSVENSNIKIQSNTTDSGVQLTLRLPPNAERCYLTTEVARTVGIFESTESFGSSGEAPAVTLIFKNADQFAGTYSIACLKKDRPMDSVITGEFSIESDSAGNPNVQYTLSGIVKSLLTVKNTYETNDWIDVGHASQGSSLTLKLRLPDGAENCWVSALQSPSDTYAWELEAQFGGGFGDYRQPIRARSLNINFSGSKQFWGRYKLSCLKKDQGTNGFVVGEFSSQGEGASALTLTYSLGGIVSALNVPTLTEANDSIRIQKASQGTSITVALRLPDNVAACRIITVNVPRDPSIWETSAEYGLGFGDTSAPIRGRALNISFTDISQFWGQHNLVCMKQNI